MPTIDLGKLLYKRKKMKVEIRAEKRKRL